MKKLLIGMIGTILLLTGALKMSQPLKKNTQYNDLTVRYYLGMTFPKYNHPAKLYDEINLDKVDNIRKSKETISYYIGFYKDGKLIKFEKYINANKVMDFAYEYDERGNLIKIYKNNIEVRKPQPTLNFQSRLKGVRSTHIFQTTLNLHQDRLKDLFFDNLISD